MSEYVVEPVLDDDLCPLTLDELRGGVRGMVERGKALIADEINAELSLFKSQIDDLATDLLAVDFLVANWNSLTEKGVILPPGEIPRGVDSSKIAWYWSVANFEVWDLDNVKNSVENEIILRSDFIEDFGHKLLMELNDFAAETISLEERAFIMMEAVRRAVAESLAGFSQGEKGFFMQELHLLLNAPPPSGFGGTKEVSYEFHNYVRDCIHEKKDLEMHSLYGCLQTVLRRARHILLTFLPDC
ncbi:hypothetical protein CVV38_01040 [Candidatus Peregrinibacteria bacterium HGW-Peregrinibacteria-1]|jgi:hypothetical protein|nr:MAG: hypothetical protein CVV38_01040 [Candidatus Peregrinibacteria bacterium HGW-Peregrinibacteria-1]